MCALKASPRPLSLIFVISTTKPMHVNNSFENKIFQNTTIEKTLKVSLSFFSNLVSFNGQNYEKEKWSGTLWPF